MQLNIFSFFFPFKGIIIWVSLSSTFNNPRSIFQIFWNHMIAVVWNRYKCKGLLTKNQKITSLWCSYIYVCDLFVNCRFDINYDIGSHMSCSQSHNTQNMNISKSDLHLATMVIVNWRFALNSFTYFSNKAIIWL